MDSIDSPITQAKEVIIKSLGEMVADGIIEPVPLPAFNVEIISKSGHGDITSNAAMTSAKALGINVSDLARDICGYAVIWGTCFKEIKTENGFINFYINNNWFSETVNNILKDECKPVTEFQNRRKVRVEFCCNTFPLSICDGQKCIIANGISTLSAFGGDTVSFSMHLKNDLSCHSEAIKNDLSKYGIKHEYDYDDISECDSIIRRLNDAKATYKDNAILMHKGVSPYNEFKFPLYENGSFSEFSLFLAHYNSLLTKDEYNLIFIICEREKKPFIDAIISALDKIDSFPFRIKPIYTGKIQFTRNRKIVSEDHLNNKLNMNTILNELTADAVKYSFYNTLGDNSSLIPLDGVMCESIDFPLYCIQKAYEKAYRICSKTNLLSDDFMLPTELLSEIEALLIRLLFLYNETLSINSFDLSILTNYANQISTVFHKYCRIIPPENQYKPYISKAFMIIIKKVLNILDIEAPKQM